MHCESRARWDWGRGFLEIDLLTDNTDSLGQTLFGIDPMMALGISTMGAGALGWLIGPFAGNAVFNLMHRKVKNDILVVCCKLSSGAPWLNMY